MFLRTFIPLALALCLAAPAAWATPMTGQTLAAARQQMVQDLSELRFDRLGNPILRWDHVPPVYAPRTSPHKLLVLLVEFPDRSFDRFEGDAAQADKLAAFYQHTLFDPDYARPNTLSHFYRTQSLETYHLQGQVLPPVKLSKPRAAYGMAQRPEGGDWRNDSDPEGLVEEALGLAMAREKGLDWDSFDRWDPSDFDGDGLLGEADGYLDHFVIVFAGGGQSSCQGLYKLHEKLTPDATAAVLKTLSAEELECAGRLWPHRFMVQKRGGSGPKVEGRVNARGGVPLRAGAKPLWARDYNMQSEYTEPSTFIHEFGHSIGLPDLYARTSNNSTGMWELMSHTASPSPQNLSAWSRIQLGWLQPKIVLPPSSGGKPVQSVYLRTLDDPLDTPTKARANQQAGLWRAALVVLPPKVRTLTLTTLPKGSALGLYSGQGNGLNRTAELRLNLKDAKGPLKLSFDAWWDIEAGWDFAYVETSVDGGLTWVRRVPTDRALMPAKHGHDGAKTLPGFTGLSGDLNGDGKNESNAACDLKRKLNHGEDKAGEKENPCKTPTWVRPAFDLSDLAGTEARIRLRYFSDMAAVMRGLLIDNLVLEGAGLKENFEGRLSREWRLDGFSTSPGQHTLLVPHYYVLEHRDPYASDAVQYRYDGGLAKPRYQFFYDQTAKEMRALRVRPRPGVVAWYVDGAFAWSENEPTENGQGKGFALVVDSAPNEIALPGLEAQFKGDATAFDTRYEVKDAKAQALLEANYYKTMCFVRGPNYRPRDLPAARLADCGPKAPVRALKVDGRALRYSYEIANERLPGAARKGLTRVGELFDYRRRKGALSWRMRDRSLRYLHTADAPFALTPFEDGVEILRVEGDGLKRIETRPHPATSTFLDASSRRWLNPKLYFGGVAVPMEGFGFQLATPKANAPEPAQVKVWFTWE